MKQALAQSGHTDKVIIGMDVAAALGSATVIVMANYTAYVVCFSLLCVGGVHIGCQC